MKRIGTIHFGSQVFWFLVWEIDWCMCVKIESWWKSWVPRWESWDVHFVPTSWSVLPAPPCCGRAQGCGGLACKPPTKRRATGVPVVAQQSQTQLMSMRMRVWSLASLGGLRNWCCCKLRCRSQTRLGSGIAVAMVQASSYSSDSTPSLRISICHGCGPKKTKKKKKNANILSKQITIKKL